MMCSSLIVNAEHSACCVHALMTKNTNLWRRLWDERKWRHAARPYDGYVLLKRTRGARAPAALCKIVVLAFRRWCVRVAFIYEAWRGLIWLMRSRSVTVQWRDAHELLWLTVILVALFYSRFKSPHSCAGLARSGESLLVWVSYWVVVIYSGLVNPGLNPSASELGLD